MTDRKQRERAEDALVQLLGACLDRQPNSQAYQDERFVTWLVDDINARQTPAEQRETGRIAREFAQRMRPRVLAQITKLRTPLLPLREHSAPERGKPPGALGTLVPWVETSAVAAGMGRELWDEPCERWVEVDEASHDRVRVAVSVHGDSMTPVLLPGDVVVLRTDAPVTEGMMVVARNNDDGYVVKRVAKMSRRRLMLESFNSAYPPLIVPRAPRTVVGVVTHILRRE